MTQESDDRPLDGSPNSSKHDLGFPRGFSQSNGRTVKQRDGIFLSAEAAIAAAVHTSACEGRTVPAHEVEDLWKMVRGEISRQDLIKKYVAEALAKQQARVAEKVVSRPPSEANAQS